MPKQVTLNIKSLEKAVADLEDIKAQISAHAGTASQRLAQAKAAVIDSVTVTLPTLPKVKTYSEVVAWLDSAKANAEQALDEAVTGHLRKSKDDSAEGLTALRETFKSKAETAAAIQTMLVSLDVAGAKDISIPTLKGTGKIGTGGGSSKANTKGQQFYRVVNGQRLDAPASQNKLSSMAWYYGAEIGVPNPDSNKTKDGFKGCSSKALKDFLKSKGIENAETVDWTYKVSDTFSVGLEIQAQEAAE